MEDREFEAEYDSWCGSCIEAVREGDLVQSDDVGYIHSECVSD